MPDFLPSRDADFLAWCATFQTGIVAGGASIGILPTQIDRFGELFGAFQALMTQVSSDETRTPSKVTQKQELRAELATYARELARIINAFPGITNAKRRELGLTMRSGERHRSVPPTEVPIVEIVSMNGHRLTARAHGSLGTRAKPTGCTSLSYFSYVGETAPLDPSVYKFEGSTTKTTFVIDFPLELAPGTKVWTTCFWKNALEESGDACDPVGTQINYATSMPTASTVRLAA